MEHFEQQTISSAVKKPAWWFRFVDDTFVVLLHGKDELHEFLKHLNSIHPNITFTMEVEQNKVLPFLDVLVSRSPDGSLGHSIYRKSTHTDLYLHAK
jgi:TFIIF-interacting CTD phosphatase-like protein